MYRLLQSALLLVLCLALCTACTSAKKNTYNLVEDEESGYSYGAMTSNAFTVDSEMFRDKRMKVRIRNTTGDPLLDMHDFKTQLEQQYSNLGYTIVQDGTYGIMLNINVRYFGQATTMLPEEYTFLAAGAGAIGGSAAGIYGGNTASTIVGGGAGALLGAALGEVLRNYATEETFIIISDVTLSTVTPESNSADTTISFVTGKSKKKKRHNFKGYRTSENLSLAVYAGGRMITKNDIIKEVRARYLRILKDIM